MKKKKTVVYFPVKEMGKDAEYVRDQLRQAIDNSIQLSNKVASQYNSCDKVPAQALQTMSQLNDSIGGLSVTLISTYKEHSKIRENELKNERTENPDNEDEDNETGEDENLNLFNAGDEKNGKSDSTSQK